MVLWETSFNSVSFNSLPLLSSKSRRRDQGGSQSLVRQQETFHWRVRLPYQQILSLLASYLNLSHKHHNQEQFHCSEYTNALKIDGYLQFWARSKAINSCVLWGAEEAGRLRAGEYCVTPQETFELGDFVFRFCFTLYRFPGSFCRRQLWDSGTDHMRVPKCSPVNIVPCTDATVGQLASGMVHSLLCSKRLRGPSIFVEMHKVINKSRWLLPVRLKRSIFSYRLY